jgi:4'-phosphopantetheinyl transferase
MHILWEKPKHLLQITENAAHVYATSLVKTMAETNSFQKVLNQEEQACAKRFLYEKHQNNFIVSRGILRILLGKYLNLAPEKIVFQKNSHGKLFLENNLISFNLAHSHEIVLYAFTVTKHIGIDIEFIRENMPYKEIAGRFFSSQEIAELFSLPPEKQIPAFFNGWARKEAFIKAIGLGLSYPLSKFSVDLSTTTQKKIPIYIYDEKFAKQNWQLFALCPTEHYAAAMVVENGIDDIAYFAI